MQDLNICLLSLEVSVTVSTDHVGKHRAHFRAEVYEHIVVGYDDGAQVRVVGDVESRQLVVGHIKSLQEGEVAERQCRQVVPFEVDESELIGCAADVERRQVVIGSPDFVDGGPVVDSELLHVVVAAEEGCERGEVLHVEVEDMVVSYVEVLEFYETFEHDA